MEESGQGNQPRDQPRISPRPITRGSGSRPGYLHALCKAGNHKKVEEFIRDCKADLPIQLVDRRGPNGYTPMHEAASIGHSKVLQVLLKYNADPNCWANYKYTPLHLAASGGHVHCVRVLLANNADIANTDEYGKTPIQTAELNYKRDVVKLLRSAGKPFVFVYHNSIYAYFFCTLD